jgi:enamine deaminase RidA (YjgF/YER057c/UK114 family)
MNLRTAMYAVVMTAGLCAVAFAQSGVTVKHIQPGTGMLAQAVWAGETLYVSGQLATPVTPADRAKGTPADYGDTKTQAASALGKIEAILKEQGLTMADVVMMHVYLAGDPKNEGKMDFAGMNAAYGQYFGTKDQPNKPSRSAMQVAALAAAGALVEIEVIAVKSK